MNNLIASESILDYLKRRCHDRWLIDHDSEELYLLTKSYFEQIKKHQQTNLVIFLGETNPVLFLACFLAAIASNSTLFLLNPNWQANEWQQVFSLVKPDLIWGNINYPIKPNYPSFNVNQPPGRIMIPTGGTSGKIKFAIHSWETLTASVRGFSQYFDLQKINCFCLLPLYHVSGLMQFLRSFITGGQLAIASYRQLKQGVKYNFNWPDFFISLVPTQLQYLLENNPQWLAEFKTVLVGGAPAGNYLLEQARKQQISIALTYGMTETASGIAILKPEDFIEGNNSSGRILPHAKVIIERPKNSLAFQPTGIIKIESESLFCGYYPHKLTGQKTLITDDIGYLDGQGYLHIIGRNSRKIITGGENVFPSEVEAIILATELVKDICVLGKSDPKWGEIVTAIYVPKKEQIAEETIKQAISKKLSKYKIPKLWLQVNNIPRNQQGKVNYTILAQKYLIN
jgi:O-succinylbenzoic acid--CoA ligase